MSSAPASIAASNTASSSPPSMMHTPRRLKLNITLPDSAILPPAFVTADRVSLAARLALSVSTSHTMPRRASAVHLVRQFKVIPRLTLLRLLDVSLDQISRHVRRLRLLEQLPQRDVGHQVSASALLHRLRDQLPNLPYSFVLAASVLPFFCAILAAFLARDLARSKLSRRRHRGRRPRDATKRCGHGATTDDASKRHRAGERHGARRTTGSTRDLLSSRERFARCVDARRAVRARRRGRGFGARGRRMRARTAELDAFEELFESLRAHARRAEGHRGGSDRRRRLTRVDSTDRRSRATSRSWAREEGSRGLFRSRARARNR